MTGTHIDDLDSALRELREPEPPTALKAIVMARTARLADHRSPSSSGSRAVVAQAPASRPDRSAWAWITAGLLLSLGAFGYGWISGDLVVDVTSPRVGFSGDTALTPPSGLFVLALTMGLVMYLVGLFAPLGRRESGR